MAARWEDAERVRDAVQVTVAGIVGAVFVFVLLWSAAAIAILLGGTP